mmetsp:Transcript_33412/g.87623  ORF Transcript_33412/g.87623 Transcript_33412/m.87623 type:complete len:275 (-) Transcript_33412:1754-2578(-)
MCWIFEHEQQAKSRGPRRGGQRSRATVRGIRPNPLPILRQPVGWPHCAKATPFLVVLGEIKRKGGENWSRGRLLYVAELGLHAVDLIVQLVEVHVLDSTAAVARRGAATVSTLSHLAASPPCNGSRLRSRTMPVAVAVASGAPGGAMGGRLLWRCLFRRAAACAGVAVVTDRSVSVWTSGVTAIGPPMQCSPGGRPCRCSGGRSGCRSHLGGHVRHVPAQPIGVALKSRGRIFTVALNALGRGGRVGRRCSCTILTDFFGPSCGPSPAPFRDGG